MESRICKRCGKIFIPTNGIQAFCRELIKVKCANCGQEFEGICSGTLSSTCSEKCKNEYASKQRQASISKATKICAWCGKEFHPISTTQKYCEGPHYSNCIICGNQFEIDLPKNDIRKTCSDACLATWRSQNSAFKRIDVREKSRKTMLDRYGVEYAAQNPELLEKQKATMKERYGAEFYAQSAQYKKEATAANLAKYGTEWPMQNTEVKEKQVATLQSNYGVDNPMQSDKIKESASDKYVNKTGYRNPLSNPDVRSKVAETMNAKFGVDHYSKTDEFKEKFTQTSLE